MNIRLLRPKVTNALLMQIANQLTDRDRFLCSLLLDHRVLTTEHICNIAFGSPITTRHRLAKLYELRILDKFRPHRPSKSVPYHWVLDVAGIHIVAAVRGLEAKEIRRLTSVGLTSSDQLEHQVGVNGFFAQLARQGRSIEDGGLTEWWSERRCGAEWGDIVRPDGFGIWKQEDVELQFFLEYDRGTETLERVVNKLENYNRLTKVVGTTVPVLFVFQSVKREAGFWRILEKWFGDGLKIPVCSKVEGEGSVYRIASTRTTGSLAKLGRFLVSEIDSR